MPSGAADKGAFSLLAPWVGGAGLPAAVSPACGYRSLLGFWVGGAGIGIAPGPAPQPSPASRFVRFPRPVPRQDEDEILLLLAWQIAAGQIH